MSVKMKERWCGMSHDTRTKISQVRILGIFLCYDCMFLDVGIRENFSTLIHKGMQGHEMNVG